MRGRRSNASADEFAFKVAISASADNYCDSLQLSRTSEWKFCPSATDAPTTLPRLKIDQKMLINLPFWPSVG